MQHCYTPAVPVLGHNHVTIAQLRLQALVKLCTPAPLFEHPPFLQFQMALGQKLPPIVVSSVVLLMQSVEYRQLCATSGIYKLLKMHDGVRVFETRGQCAIQFTIRVEKVIVWVYEDDGGIQWNRHGEESR